MPIKCESCRFFYGRVDNKFDRLPFDHSSCVHRDTPEPINEARSVCDREGDVRFVFFEPKDPSTGAAAAGPQAASLPDALQRRSTGRVLPGQNPARSKSTDTQPPNRHFTANA